mmetsp:Transcript_14090/g.23136  ORF Transcript_14090/g.23136 Transcript_14090/m.23136 type:complete len:423 (-) Transcript_14090:37-1305(-)
MISQAVSFTSRALNAIKITHNTYRFSSCLPRPSINQITIAYTALDLQNMAETNSSKDDAAITDIEDLHRHAIMNKQSTYIDPATGFTVFTELSHLKRGKCCGNMCRHCPYGWSNVRGASEENASSARAVSGDRECTGRLVKQILDGTYYDDEDTNLLSTKLESNDANSSTIKPSLPVNSEKSTSTNISRGKGGRAGGTFTSKNVPYTRGGDKGTSQLFTGERRKKDDILFEALGTVDELCSVVGVVYAELKAAEKRAPTDNGTTKSIYGELPEQLLEVMSRLFDVGSHVAKPVPNIKEMDQSQKGNKGFSSDHTTMLEEWIDAMTEELPELTSFILPTGSVASSNLHVARTVCRRAERRMVPLVQEEETCDPDALAYVNRLSDYLFTAARYVNFCDGSDETQYRKAKSIVQRERIIVKLNGR